MLALTIGLLSTVAIAVVVVLLVAIPHLRNGSRILTPRGRRQVRVARELGVAAASTATQTVARGASAAVNGAVNGIKAIDVGKPAERPRLRGFGRRAEPAPEPAPDEPVDVTAQLWSPVNRGAPEPPSLPPTPVPGRPNAVGQQRPSPVDSGPIPEVAAGTRDGGGGLVDLRPSGLAEADGWQGPA